LPIFFIIGRLESTLCVLALYEPVFDSLTDISKIRIIFDFRGQYIKEKSNYGIKHNRRKFPRSDKRIGQADPGRFLGRMVRSLQVSGSLAPALEDASNDLSEKIAVYKLNIDENPVAPQKYGVRGVPTIVFFRNGEEAGRQVGLLPKSKLYEKIEKIIYGW